MAANVPKKKKPKLAKKSVKKVTMPKGKQVRNTGY